MPCESGSEDSKCYKMNVLYENTCLECAAGGREVIYIGESSRSAHERANDHVRDYRYCTKDSQWRLMEVG